MYAYWNFGVGRGENPVRFSNWPSSSAPKLSRFLSLLLSIRKNRSN